MKYGMNMLLWTSFVEEKHFDLLESLKDMGYDHIEISITEGDPDHYAKVGRFLDELGVSRTAIGVACENGNALDADKGARDIALAHNIHSIDCCTALGTNLMPGPFHSRFAVFSGEGPTEDEWKWGVETMQRTADYAMTQKMTLSLEFLNRFECYFLNTAGDTARFVRDVGFDNVGILYDTHHANIEEKSVRQAILENGDLINHVHISENDRSTPGAGQVSWEETFDSLCAINYGGDLIVEAFGPANLVLKPALKIWRKAFETEEILATDALAFMKRECALRGM